MCGLFGVAGNIFNKDVEIFKDLMLASQTRGVDATGIAAYKYRERKVDIFKATVPSSLFLEIKHADKLMNPQYDLLMGHTRKATGAWQSKGNQADAHPFEHGNVVGAHNGVIPYECLRQLDHKIEGAIDSEQVIHNIAEEGITKVIPKLWGAYALSLLDIKEAKLAFVRNSQRPLAFMASKNGQTIYWASEAAMLYWAVTRNTSEIKDHDPYILPEDTLIAFDWLDKRSFADTMEKFSMPGGKEPEKKSYQWTPPKGSGGNGTTTQTHGGGNVVALSSPTGTNRPQRQGPPVSPLQGVIRAIESMELKLLEFDFATINNWPKKERAKYNSLLQSIQNLYKQIASGTLSETVVERGEPDKSDPMSNTIRAKLHDDGCAFCATSDVSDAHLKGCTIGSSGEVLCPRCAQDELLLAAANAPQPREVIHLPPLVENQLSLPTIN